MVEYIRIQMAVVGAKHLKSIARKDEFVTFVSPAFRFVEPVFPPVWEQNMNCQIHTVNPTQVI